MGEYWKPVNFTRGEFLHPHRLDCGLKFGEWVHPHSQVIRRIDELIAKGQWAATDDIAAVSDYTGFFQLRGVPSEHPKREDGRYPYEWIDEEFKDVSLPEGYK